MDIHHIKCNENQLTSLSGLDSSGAWVTVSYRYDPMGRRISSTLNNQTTLYAYDGWNVVEEYNTASPTTPTKIYTWGIDLSGTTQGAGGVGGLLYTEDLSSGTAWHHHYDGNGNVTHLTDASATSIASYTYDAFGNTETATGPAATTNKYRFSTKPIDNTIQANPLYYYGYRFYNPETGRWLNRDPIEEKGGLNLYGFVGNDGVGRIDMLGNSDTSCGASIEYILQNDSYLKNIVSSINKKKGCKMPNFKCICCKATNPSAGGYYQIGENKIKICWDNILEFGSDFLVTTMRHEMTHAYQDCKNTLKNGDCKSMMCAEIQAYFGQFPDHLKKNPKLLKESIRESVKNSLEAAEPKACMNVDEDLTNNFNDIYDECAASPE